MKKIIFALTLIMSLNAFSMSVTKLVAYTLAETIYVTALTGATTEVSSNITSSKNQKLEAIKLQNDIQNYFQSEEITPFLGSKIEMANKVYPDLSLDETIDALLDSTEIILAK